MPKKGVKTVDKPEHHGKDRTPTQTGFLKTLAARMKFSWTVVARSGDICLHLMCHMSLWIPFTIAPLAGAILIVYGVLWIAQGIQPLFMENRPTSVTISCAFIIASGGCILGLGVAMMTPVMTDVAWVPRMAGIFYNLAFFVWLSLIVKTAPMTTQRLFIGTVLCNTASGYVLFCHAMVLINLIVPDIPPVVIEWELMIGYSVSGGAIIGWSLSVIRTAAPPHYKYLVPAYTILGVIYIGFGIVIAIVLISR